jgi:hypothetical protein
MKRLLIPTLVCLVSAPALARPSAPAIFCDTEPDAPMCVSQQVSCFQCHDGPPSMNPYGESVQIALLNIEEYDGGNFDELLPSAILEVALEDSDADGIPNTDEIAAGTLPGDPASFPTEGPEPAPEQGVNEHYTLGEWDPALALKRVKLLYCGVGPSLFEMDGLAAAPDPRAVVHDLLEDCLTSDFWRDEALPRLADPKVRPVKTVGPEGQIILGDYDWDYRLFAHALTGDRPATDLLLADYHVDENGNVVEGLIPREREGLFQISDPETGQLHIGGGQPALPEVRAGMITTQWFLGMNTMFSQMPRTTAAQAYRAYLGLDIAKGQGLNPVENEPRDVDGKGVTQPACAACHSTLDPLSYAFSAYNGFDPINGAPIALVNNNLIGAYNPERTPWEGDGSLFGLPVQDVRDWAEIAAGRDEFKRATAEMFFKHALGVVPGPDDQDEFTALWSALPAEFTASQLIHDLVDTDAFGSP